MVVVTEPRVRFGYRFQLPTLQAIIEIWRQKIDKSELR
jgi:hypothetical protein